MSKYDEYSGIKEDEDGKEWEFTISYCYHEGESANSPNGKNGPYLNPPSPAWIEIIDYEYEIGMPDYLQEEVETYLDEDFLMEKYNDN